MTCARAGVHDAGAFPEEDAYARILGAFDAGVVVPAAIEDYDSLPSGC
jgi:hypothetical protein